MALDIEKVEMIILEAEERFQKTTDVYRSDLSSIRAGRANPHVLDKIRVDYYGELSPLNQVGNIGARSLISIAVFSSIAHKTLSILPVGEVCKIVGLCCSPSSPR